MELWEFFQLRANEIVVTSKLRLSTELVRQWVVRMFCHDPKLDLDNELNILKIDRDLRCVVREDGEIGIEETDNEMRIDVEEVAVDNDSNEVREEVVHIAAGDVHMREFSRKMTTRSKSKL
ncbi:hypothetical protein RJT34_05101 [Clitoria ternatea]|uniref:Uncharacterized protein n=1 Tax=Clitoria ternatea TaxID=43366 RepID=A0AAN9K2Q8_CLITE